MLQRARSLRHELTPAERLLWAGLRAGRLGGFKFRRQMWLCGYVADFACPEAKLVVEADGSQHGQQEEYDAQRSEAFAREGFRTLRFWNSEIFENLDGVLAAIRAALPCADLPSPSHPAAPGLDLPSPSHPAAPGGPLPLPNWERGS
jgi:very-short-patch-repair endonuclease